MITALTGPDATARHGVPTSRQLGAEGAGTARDRHGPLGLGGLGGAGVTTSLDCNRRHLRSRLPISPILEVGGRDAKNLAVKLPGRGMVKRCVVQTEPGGGRVLRLKFSENICHEMGVSFFVLIHTRSHHSAGWAGIFGLTSRIAIWELEMSGV
jgi:hypothetical protein